MNQTFSATINGEPVLTARRLSVINPATEEVFADAPNCGAAELQRAIDAARAAYEEWKSRPVIERQAAVRTMGARIVEHKDELMRLLTAEQGKPHSEALRDVLGGAMWCDVYAAMDVPLEVVEDSEERRIEVRRVPIGVVAAITPWNFPIFTATMKVAPALVAGNTVILKPSPFTPLTTLRLGELCRDVFPAGVFNVLSGDDELGPLLSQHPGIDKISFTGSTVTGRQIMASAAKSLKRLTLELGGNDAAIIMPDVDIDAVAEQIFNAAFGNSGQVCVATKRLYIHSDIYDRFAQALVARVRTAKIGDGAQQGTDFGPVQNKRQYDRVRDLIADARSNGYRFLTGGGDYSQGRRGYFIPLTLIDNPPDTARIVREEQFGPVLPLLRFENVEEVVARANSTEYGLGAQVWSANEVYALEIGGRLETGNVFINLPQTITPKSPFGGHKASGIGEESALHGLLAFTNSQTVMVGKQKPRAAMSTPHGAR